MSTIEQIAVTQAYEARFGNIDTIANSQALCDPRFYELLQKAIDTNTPLDCAAIDAAIPDLSWEE